MTKTEVLCDKYGTPGAQPFAYPTGESEWDGVETETVIKTIDLSLRAALDVLARINVVLRRNQPLTTETFSDILAAQRVACLKGEKQ